MTKRRLDHTLLCALAALIPLGLSGGASAQDDCRLGEPGCSIPGATITVEEESFRPERTAFEGDRIDMIVAVQCQGAPGMVPMDLYFYSASENELGGPFTGSEAQWRRLVGQQTDIGSFALPAIECRFPQQVRYTTAAVGQYAGTYYVTACLDTALISDAAQRCTAPLEVSVQPRPRPDVAVDLSVDKLEAASGEVVELSVAGSNVGEAYMAEGFVDVLWSRDQLWDGRNDNRIQLVPLKPLQPGEGFRTSVEHVIEAGRGEIFYHACAIGVIGRENASTERVLANNCSETLSLTVR